MTAEKQRPRPVEPDPDPDAIRAFLRQTGTDAELLFFPETDSTNSEAERQLAWGRSPPFAVLAAAQTRGRGRLGRRWHSPPEGNLYASFVFRPRMPRGRIQAVTLWMALRACDFLRGFTGLPLGVKWPNDLVLEGKKAGGILTEARVDMDRTLDLILGLGVNVNSRCQGWPAETDGKAVSLAAVQGNRFDLNRLAAGMTQTIWRAYDDFFLDGRPAKMRELWERLTIWREGEVRLRTTQGALKGKAEGIDDNGALLLRLPGGRVEAFHSGEADPDTGTK